MKLPLGLRAVAVSLPCALATVAPIAAFEGMWMPSQVPELAGELRDLGFEGDPEGFSDLTGHPIGAVVSLGFCTASFVSPDGLLITNHHCATGALQFNSTPGSNRLEEGFLARTRPEERSAGPGSRVWVTTSFRDVTRELIDAIASDLPDVDRAAALRRRTNEAVATCERTFDRCQVRAFFGGLRWYEIGQVEILDVRLVAAPPSSVGDFGGETDNFSWPRHAGDWAFLRAYVRPDGTPAAYAPDNVPYRPKRWLRIATEGVAPGDLAIVVGYPGRTYRLRTLAEVVETLDWSLPERIRVAEEQIAILRGLAATSEDLAIKAGAALSGLENGLKYRRGVLAGLVGAGALDAKRVEDRELRAWIAANDERRQRYADVLPALDAIQAERTETRETAAALAGLRSASDYLDGAYDLYRLAIERARPDLDRRPGYQDRDVDDIRRTQERRQKTLDARIDRAMLRHALGRAAALPEDRRIAPLDAALGIAADAEPAIRDAAIERWLDSAYAATKIGDLDFRLALLARDARAIAGLDDPFVRLAVALHPTIASFERDDDRRDGADSRLRPRLLEAVLDLRGGRVAPDANGTLRVTFGIVEGAEVRDGLAYTPRTTLRGLRAKHTGEGEFDAPDAVIAAIDDLHAGRTSSRFVDPSLGDVPVDFLSSVDTTGGNSGSPTLDRRGRLIGLLFDGTWESIAADYVFDPATNRSIHVDIRYVLWMLETVERADALLRELGVPGVDAVPDGGLETGEPGT